MADERLNRYVSRAAGVSRRTADELIRAGRVTVDGKRLAEPGAMVDAERADIRVDGSALVPAEEEKIYVMLFKPDNVVSTMKDKEGRKTVASMMSELPDRVYPVGRLDYHTTGLLLLTNDGDLSYRLTHPRFGVEKTYIAKVAGTPTPGRLDVLRRGLPIDGEMTNPARVNFIETREGKSWIRISIAEGRYHQVRKMFDAIGNRVTKLRRVAIGPLELSGVEPGHWRYLSGKEVRELRAYVEEREREAKSRPPGPVQGHASRRAPSTPRQPKPAWKKPSQAPKAPGRGPRNAPRKPSGPPGPGRRNTAR